MASITCQWRHTHDSVDAVKDCHAWHSVDPAARESEALAEQAAEAANERFWENRGWEEARAQEDYEALNGMLSYEAAKAQWEATQV